MHLRRGAYRAALDPPRGPSNTLEHPCLQIQLIALDNKVPIVKYGGAPTAKFCRLEAACGWLEAACGWLRAIAIAICGIYGE